MFVYAEGAQAFETHVSNRHRRNFGAAVKIPVPWDPVYKRDFERIIKQLGERYARDPLCVSVVLTCANFMSAEMHLPKAQSDFARWRALGNYEPRLSEVYKKFTDVWATAFPTQEYFVVISPRCWTYRHRFRKAYRLWPRQIPEALLDSELPADRTQGRHRCNDLRPGAKVSTRAHHGFQSLAGLNRPDGRMGSPRCRTQSRPAGAEYWELWHGDGFSVTTSSQAANAWRRQGNWATKLTKRN